MNEKRSSSEYSCADCASSACVSGGREGHYPDFCLSQSAGEDRAADSLRQYLDDPMDRKLVLAAERVLAAGYEKWPRVQEVIAFAKAMRFRKIGIATCTALLQESRTLAKMLRINGFEVYGVGCKVGELDKSSLDIPREYQSMGTIACNPVLQAQLLAEEGTQLNIVMGLCVGHDILFSKYSQAPSTTLVVKDRVLVHNPAAAFYASDGCYSRLMRPLDDF